jgi:hypothetical protein
MTLRNRIRRTTRKYRRVKDLQARALKLDYHRLAYGAMTSPWFGDQAFWRSSMASRHMRYMEALIRSRRDEERECSARQHLPPKWLAASKWQRALAQGPVLVFAVAV